MSDKISFLVTVTVSAPSFRPLTSMKRSLQVLPEGRTPDYNNIFLHEPLTWKFCGGGALILASIVALNRRIVLAES